MRRSAFVIVVAIALFACLVAGACVALVSHQHQVSGPPHRADFVGTADAADASPRQCMFVIAGKDATADGSVLMGYNNDWSTNNYSYLKVVPATQSSYGYVRIMTLGKYREGGINDHQVSVCYGVAVDRAAAVAVADPWINKGVGEYMWDVILERCATAREAIDYLEKSARTEGFSIWAAGSFGIADAKEAWVVELLGGHHWVAARVPDDAYYAQPNMLRLRQVDLSDPANFRGSPDLVSFAQELGLYDPAEGPFDVAWAYGDRADLQSYYNTNRLWGATLRWSPSLASDPAMPYAERPVFAVPDRPLATSDVMAVMREHYEGTQLDQTEDYTLMSPHQQTNRPVCCPWTDYSVVFQCRDELPDGVGGVLWLAPSRPCSSAYVPFYCSVAGVPAPWADRKAYVAFRTVALSLDKKGTVDGVPRYARYIGLVRETYGAFAADTLARQADVERIAADLWETDRARAVALLTKFSNRRATTAFDLALGLPAQMP
jgi:dipeptidase